MKKEIYLTDISLIALYIVIALACYLIPYFAVVFFASVAVAAAAAYYLAKKGTLKFKIKQE
jgi:hypothetical protein